MRSVRSAFVPAALLMLLLPTAVPSARGQSKPAGQEEAATGFAVKKPVFGGACQTCPWGSMGEFVKEALKSYGWDVQICYSCAGGARAARLMAAAVMAPPPPNPGPNDPPTPPGRIDFGATGTQLAWWAYQGANEFAKDPEGPRKNLRLIANIQQPAYFAAAVKADSGITDLHQIVERRMPVKILAANIIGDTPVLLDYYGLTKEKMESFGGELRTQTGADNRKNVDVVLGWASLVNAPEYNMWYELSQRSDLKFLPLPKDLLEKWAKQYDFEIRPIPPGLFRGVDKPVDTVVRTGTVIYGRDDMPDDFTYTVAKAIDEHQDLLQWANGGMNFSYNYRTVWKAYGMPLAPGAAKYYKERGYMK